MTRLDPVELVYPLDLAELMLRDHVLVWPFGAEWSFSLQAAYDAGYLILHVDDEDVMGAYQKLEFQS